MSFADPIPVLDVNVTACVLVALGIVTIWYGRSLEVAASGRKSGSVADWHFDPLADAGNWVAARSASARSLLSAVWQALRSTIAGAERRRTTSTSTARARASGGTSVAVDSAHRLTLEQQVQTLQSRILGHVDAARASQRLHLAAGRQLDAVDYALERLRAEVDLLLTTGRANAAPDVRPRPRIVVLGRAHPPAAEAA